MHRKATTLPWRRRRFECCPLCPSRTCKVCTSRLDWYLDRVVHFDRPDPLTVDHDIRTCHDGPPLRLPYESTSASPTFVDLPLVLNGVLWLLGDGRNVDAAWAAGRRGAGRQPLAAHRRGRARPILPDPQRIRGGVARAIVSPCPPWVDAMRQRAGRDLGSRAGLPLVCGPLGVLVEDSAGMSGRRAGWKVLSAPAAVRPGGVSHAPPRYTLAGGWMWSHPSCPRRARQQGESRGLTVRSGRQTAPLASTSAVRVHSVNPPGTFRTCTARNPRYAGNGGALPLRVRTGTTLTWDSR